MTILDLYNLNRKKYQTDKETRHSYLSGLYQHLFKNKQQCSRKILEIGVWVGGSMLLWKDYFHNAQIYGIDIRKCDRILNDERIIFFKENAYSKQGLSLLGDNFDIIIDDGPHTLNSMIFTIQNYSNLLSDDGILIIEDVQSYDWFDTLIDSIPKDKNITHKIVDLRSSKNRYDDMLLIIENNG